MDKHPPSIRRAGKAELLLLLLVFAAPILGAWIIYTYTDIGKGDNNNYGELIDPPLMVQDASLFSIKDNVIVGSLVGKWSLIYVLPGNCDQSCIKNSDMLQRLKSSLSKNSGRLQLVFFKNGGLDGLPLSVLSTPTNRKDLFVLPLEGMFESLGDDYKSQILQESEFLLADPKGRLMMSYKKGSEGAGIINDIKRLLRFSWVG
jgi:cytochrome oxidase Cu insertion factor (SCO1/SenC/PrrC family)